MLHALIVYAIYIYCEILHDVNGVWQAEKSGFCVNCMRRPRFAEIDVKMIKIKKYIILNSIHTQTCAFSCDRFGKILAGNKYYFDKQGCRFLGIIKYTFNNINWPSHNCILRLKFFYLFLMATDSRCSCKISVFSKNAFLVLWTIFQLSSCMNKFKSPNVKKHRQ